MRLWSYSILLVVLAACSEIESESITKNNADRIAFPHHSDDKIVNLGVAIDPRTTLAEIADGAFRFNGSVSSGPSRIQAAIGRREALGLPEFLELSPRGSVSSSGSGVLGLAASVPVVDFGRIKSRRLEAEMELLLASAEFWTENNEVVSDSLGHVIEISSTRAKRLYSKETTQLLSEFLEKAESQVKAGAADKSELLLLDLFRSEVETQIAEDEAQIEASLIQLNALINSEYALGQIPLIEALNASVYTIPRFQAQSDISPDVFAAEISVQIAESQLDLLESFQFPSVVLQGLLLSSGSPGLTLALDADSFLGLSGPQRKDAAKSEVAARKALLARTKREYRTELFELGAEQQRISKLILRQRKLELKALSQIETFEKQLLAGSRSNSDFVSVARTYLDSQRDRADFEAQNLFLAVRQGELTGRLITWGLKFADG